MQAGAAIINTASIQAYQPDPMLLAYAATKAAIVNFTKGLAQETIESGIRVNAVAPGPTRTGMISDDIVERFREVIGSLVDRTALGRLGDGEDVGKVIATLLSDECGWITGEHIEVSGGFRL